NPLLNELNPYPFEKLRNLLGDIKANPNLEEINLTIGEPMHAVPEFIPQILADQYLKLSKYPTTTGTDEFREVCSNWLKDRYAVTVDAKQQILSVNGSREALFSFAQSMLDTQDKETYVVVPNPFYQIYEGAAILAGAKVAYANTYAPRYIPKWDEIEPDVWEKTQLVFVCTPGNPTGAVMNLQDWAALFELQKKYDFTIASDECYSEIYFLEKPLGILQAAQVLNLDFSKKIMFTSLSKRSNLPGLRSGFVAGDADLISHFLKYRTYHGSATSGLVQEVSIAAWQDESHVENNRALYQEKFEKVMPILKQKYEVTTPDASF
ncbi:MAG: aminotransferase class I/II-fold pyridoxal phosphate-dependent enzyme, partial [Neisseriaceae bacterium]|nr:aminotransferase class I/II-fold pyridoxal phosphate-dependent enzyme [Neisseriaceae bacterium]